MYMQVMKNNVSKMYEIQKPPLRPFSLIRIGVPICDVCNYS